MNRLVSFRLVLPLALALSSPDASIAADPLIATSSRDHDGLKLWPPVPVRGPVNVSALDARFQQLRPEFERCRALESWPSPGRDVVRVVMTNGRTNWAWTHASTDVPASVRDCLRAALGRLRGPLTASPVDALFTIELSEPPAAASSPSSSVSATPSVTPEPEGSAPPVPSSSGPTPMASSAAPPLPAEPIEPVPISAEATIVPTSACMAGCDGEVTDALLSSLQHRAQLGAACFRRLPVPGEPATLPAGSLDLEVTIASDGHVCGVMSTSDPFQRPSLTACLGTLFSEPVPPPAVGCVRVHVPLRFVGR